LAAWIWGLVKVLVGLRLAEGAQQPLAPGGLVLADDGVVELGLVDRDGKVVAGLEGQRAAELVGLHPGHVDCHRSLIAAATTAGR
jgi:hypothetical protein